MFGFQKLDVYRCSVAFLGVASALAERVPRGYSALADQLRRAALSVPLNIAEGSGKGTIIVQVETDLSTTGFGVHADSLCALSAAHKARAPSSRPRPITGWPCGVSNRSSRSAFLRQAMRPCSRNNVAD